MTDGTCPAVPGPVIDMGYLSLPAGFQRDMEWLQAIDRALQGSIDLCARCKTCEEQAGAVLALIRPLLAELDEARVASQGQSAAAAESGSAPPAPGPGDGATEALVLPADEYAAVRELLERATAAGLRLKVKLENVRALVARELTEPGSMVYAPALRERILAIIGSEEGGLPRVTVDLNVRVRKHETYGGFEDVTGADPASLRWGDRVLVVEAESRIFTDAIVTAVDTDKRLVYLVPDWHGFRDDRVIGSEEENGDAVRLRRSPLYRAGKAPLR